MTPDSSLRHLTATAPQDLFDLTGMVLGKYRLTERLGQGGMAQVYKAYQSDLDRYVALKVLHPRLTSDAAFTERFHREARAVAALDHPNILRVYDFSSESGVAFLVMEYLDGVNLREILNASPSGGRVLSLDEAIAIVTDLAAALAHAHSNGVIHRDIKPANVIITGSGRTVLTDFGVALMVDATAISDSGGTPGTPTYMSPEQGQGAPGDARSDIYALGVLLYQLCTGRVPFEADTPYAVVLKHITAPLPMPRSLRPDLPEALEHVILKALSKAPRDRYQQADDFAAALRSVGSPPAGEPKGAPQPRWPVSRGRLLVASVLLVVSAVALFLRLRQSPSQVTAPTTALLLDSEAIELTLVGPEAGVDTWLDPDLPEAQWAEVDLVHLQGPLTPDRLLFSFDLAALPEDMHRISATLRLRTELWGDQSLPGAAVVYRVLTPWDVLSVTYTSPWSAPGLAAGIDYDSVPLDIVNVPDNGFVTFDVTAALEAWCDRGAPNYGLAVMMSEDSHNMAHHWVYMSEQPNLDDRPTLTIVGRRIDP